MTLVKDAAVSVRNADRLFIDGEWVKSSADATIDVVDSDTEELSFQVAAAQPADIDRAVDAARHAFDNGPWPRVSHAERAGYLRAIADELRKRTEDVAQLWPREAGVLYSISQSAAEYASRTFEYYAELADTYPFEEPVTPTAGGEFGLLMREPVGVVAAIVPWNAPLAQMAVKVAPALLTGCTVVVKPAPEAPGEAYILAEAVAAAGLPRGVVNVLTAERGVSEHLVTNPGVDKIAFTGSTEVGRRIASLCGERIARYTLELGGKSAALILDDIDISSAAQALAGAECFLSGQVCSSLTRVIVPKQRQDDFAEALAATFSHVHIGDPFDASTQMGPLASQRQRDRVEGLIARGIVEGATLVSGGGRPKHLDRGWYVEPTVFSNVDNASTIGSREIFGPVLSVIPADNEEDAIALANDTIYGLNASVFTNDVNRARAVASRLRAGTVGHNAFRTDFGISFGGYKQSGIGREGGTEGVRNFLETKLAIFESRPANYPGQGC